MKSIDINTSIIRTTQNINIIKDLHDTQVALARFADNQFEQISIYMKSPQFENLKECVVYSYKGINEHSITEDKDIRSAMILNQRQNTNDVAELEHIQKERDNYLILALKLVSYFNILKKYIFYLLYLLIFKFNYINYIKSFNYIKIDIILSNINYYYLLYYKE